MAQLSRYFAAVLLIFPLIWVGCHDPDSYVLTSDESPKVDALFTLRAAGDTILPADGVSSLQLVAQVHDVSEGLPSILFTTTAGTLRVGAESYADSVVVPVNAQGEVRIELVSSPEEATAQVRAAAVDIRPPLEQELRVHFPAVSHEDMIVFVDPPDSAFAHGLALVPFTVRIAATLEGNEREVRFQTTQGTFPFASDSTSQLQVVRAGADGMATAHLRTSDQVGEAMVRATVGAFYQEAAIHFVMAPTDSVLRFMEAPETAPADGKTLSRFAVRVSPHLQPDEDRTVEFATTAGRFVLSDSDATKATVRADAAGVARAHLRSPSEFDEAIVQASVKGFIQQHTLQFDWAGPDSIAVSLESGRRELPADEEMDVVARLLRLAGRGKVTQDLEVSFELADSLGNRIPEVRFTEVTSTDSKGEASAVMQAGGTPYRGRATVLVRPARMVSDVVGREELVIIEP